MLGADDILPAQVLLTVQELKGVAAPIADVDPPLRGRRPLQGLDRMDPQQRLAAFPVAPLRDGFPIRDCWPAVEDLVDQAEDGTIGGGDRQTVVAEEALAGAIADLAELRVQLRVRAVIQFRRVMQDQDRAVEVAEGVKRSLAVARQDSLVGDLGTVHQVVAAAESVGVGKLVWEAAAGMLEEAVGEIDEGAGAPPIVQGGSAEVVRAEVLGEMSSESHWVIP